MAAERERAGGSAEGKEEEEKKTEMYNEVLESGPARLGRWWWKGRMVRGWMGGGGWGLEGGGGGRVARNKDKRMTWLE